MSDTSIIRALLASNATLAALVPAERIRTGTIPQGIALPAILISTVSSNERHRVADNCEPILITARTEVTVLAKNYMDQRKVIDLVGKAIRGGRRMVGGVLVANIRTDIVGPDMHDKPLDIYMQSRDFQVVYYGARAPASE